MSEGRVVGSITSPRLYRRGSGILVGVSLYCSAWVSLGLSKLSLNRKSEVNFRQNCTRLHFSESPKSFVNIEVRQGNDE